MATKFDSTEVEWGSFSIAINGVNIVKIRGIKYKVESEDEDLHAQGNEPFGIQSGNRKYSGEVKMLKGAVDGLNDSARAAGYKDMADVPPEAVSIVCVYAAKGSRTLQTDTCMGVKFSSFEYGFDQGAKFMEISTPFKFLSLKQQ